MAKYLFSQNAESKANADDPNVNFLFHINHFDWPITHGHADYWEFTIITNGTITDIGNCGKHEYETNSLFVATTRDVHKLVSRGTDSVRYVNIMVKEKYILKILENFPPRLTEAFYSKNYRILLPENAINEIEQILLQVNYFTPQYKKNNQLICSAFLLLLSYVLRNLTAQPAKIPQYLTLLNRITQNNELLTYNVNDLCGKLGYSRTQLNFLFKRHFGITPHEYLIKFKFNHAKKLLTNTNLSIAEISYAIGYSNPMQFYTTFKKIFRLTPNEYRRKKLKR